MGDCPSVTVESVLAFVTKFIREKEAEVAQMENIQNQLLNKIAILDGKGVVRNQIDDLYRWLGTEGEKLNIGSPLVAGVLTDLRDTIAAAETALNVVHRVASSIKTMLGEEPPAAVSEKM